MDKQKVRPLDEERESRSVLSNVVVILHLILGTLPILLVVWAVDNTIRNASRRILWNLDLARTPVGLQCPYTIEVAYHKSFATLAARFLSRTESWRLGEYY